VVIQALCSEPAQMREGGDVLANRRGEVLTFDKVHVLAAGISENVTERMDAPLALGGEIDVVRGIVHLPLKSGRRFESANQGSRAAAQLAQLVADDRVGAGESEPTELFQHPDRGDLGIAFQKLNDVVPE